MRIRLLIAVACCLLALQGCTPKEQAARVLSYASPYSPNHPFSIADQQWIDYVQQQSGGELKIHTYWAGSLISSDMSMLEIRHGVADIGLITPIYTKGGVHLLRTQAGFYGGVQSIEDQVAVYNCIADKFAQFSQEMHGLKVLAVQGGNFPGVLTRDKPISSLEDFKGMRLRVQTEAVEVLRHLGADPVNMPMGEVYSALAKGVIDGVVAPADTIHSLHFSEVAKHFTRIRFARGAYPARAMSMQTWNSLPVYLQKIIMDGRKVWEAALAHELTKSEEKGLSFGSKQGITFHPFPEHQQREFNLLYNQVALEQSRSIRDLNIDAEPVFYEAQNIIANGSPIQCNRNDQ